MGRPTPFQVALAILVQETLTNEELEPESRNALVAFLSRQVQTSATHERSYAELCESLPSNAQQAFDFLDEKIKSFKWPDDIVEFFSVDLPRLLHADSTPDNPQILELGSIFGLFIRRIILEFNRLSFEDVSRLFEALRRFRAGRSRQSMQGGSPQHSPHEDAAVAGPSGSQIDEFLDNDLLLKHDGLIASPFAVELKARELVQAGPAAAQASFLRLLNASSAGDYEGALDALHRYFDSCPTRSTSQKPSAAPGTDGQGATSSGSTMYGSLQFALLDLALLHLQLGHWALAFQAAEEAVRIAHQNNDHASLAHALVPLAAIMPSSAAPCLLNESTLSRAITRAKALEHWELAAKCSLELARRDLLTPVNNASNAAFRQNQYSPTVEAYAFLKDAFQLIAENGRLLHLAPHGNAIQALGWSLVGCGSLAALYHRIQLHFGSNSPALACSALCNLASLKLSQGDVKEGVSLLNEAATRYKTMHSQLPITKVLTSIAFGCAIDRGMPHYAEHLARVSIAMTPSHDTGPYIDALVASIRAAAACGRTNEAITQMEDLVDQSEALGLHTNALNALLTMAPMLVDLECWELAIGVLLKATSMAEKHGLEGIRAECVIKLASLVLQAGAQCNTDAKEVARDVQNMINVFLPQLLDSGPAQLCGEALMVLANCHIVRSAHVVQKRVSELHRAASLLEQAETSLRGAGCAQQLVEVLHARALVENALGNQQKRDRAASLYRTLVCSSRTPPCMSRLDVDTVSELLHVL